MGLPLSPLLGTSTLAHCPLPLKLCRLPLLALSGWAPVVPLVVCTYRVPPFPSQYDTVAPSTVGPVACMYHLKMRFHASCFWYAPMSASMASPASFTCLCLSPHNDICMLLVVKMCDRIELLRVMICMIRIYTLNVFLTNMSPNNGKRTVPVVLTEF